MKMLTSLARFRSLVGLAVIWIFVRTICRGEVPNPGGAEKALGQAVPAGMAFWHISLALLQTIVMLSAVTFAGFIVMSLLVELATSAILARGGMGHKRVAETAVKVSLLSSHALKATASFSCLLCFLEVCALALYPSVSAWGTYGFPMLFTLLLIAATDFSLLKKQERLRLRIALSEGSHRMLFEKSLVGTYKANLDGRILDCNFSFCQIFGYASREEVIGNSLTFGCFNAEERDEFNNWLQSENHLTNFEQCLRRKDGGTAWILNTATLVRSGLATRPVIKGTMLDISDLRMELPAWLKRMGRILVAVRMTFLGARQA